MAVLDWLIGKWLWLRCCIGLHDDEVVWLKAERLGAYRCSRCGHCLDQIRLDAAPSRQARRALVRKMRGDFGLENRGSFGGGDA